jgi:hypothetical protein
MVTETILRENRIMSQEQLIQAVADQAATLASQLGRPPEAVLEDMYRYLFKQNMRSFIATNRAEAEALGYTSSDIDTWVEEDRREQQQRVR